MNGSAHSKSPPGDKRTAVIIGAGPAGLTAALELLRQTDVHPIVLEASDLVGGIARTEVYKGNRIDIGGHRFFSKSDRVMDWWLDIMPLEDVGADEVRIRYQNKERDVSTPAPGANVELTDLVMLLRSRKSRIYYLRKFFDYPISLSASTITGLGLGRTARVGLSYVKAAAFPRKEEKTLEDFLINRFGRVLYETFFRDYTEKVWGVPCDQITAEWGAQRIKGLSITKAVLHYIKSTLGSAGNFRQKGTETSLIEQFLYPKLGPGQMWEEVARRVVEGGGEVRHGALVQGIDLEGDRVRRVHFADREGKQESMEADFVISTMPIKDLVRGMQPEPPARVAELARGLVYRDFITVGLLARDLKIKEADGTRVKDNWIYIQEPDVKVGRLQIFNNWSPYLVANAEKTWIGLEYFCTEGDSLWELSEEQLKALAEQELHKIGILSAGVVEDSVVIRVPKTYPAYFGTYEHFDELRAHLDTVENLFLIGRNGMHRYNNQDHSMLTAMAAVEAIRDGSSDKSPIWSVNAEADYHEERESDG